MSDIDTQIILMWFANCVPTVTYILLEGYTNIFMFQFSEYDLAAEHCLFAGFIDFIVEPSFTVMGDMLDKILIPLRNPSQASIHDDPISEEVFDKEKQGTGGSRSSSARSNVSGKWTLQL